MDAISCAALRPGVGEQALFGPAVTIIVTADCDVDFLVAEWALAERRLERLELGHRVNNPASGVVARRAGFVKEGTQRQKFLVEGERLDVDTYGRLKTDPHPAFDPLPMVTR